VMEELKSVLEELHSVLACIAKIFRAHVLFSNDCLSNSASHAAT